VTEKINIETDDLFEDEYGVTLTKNEVPNKMDEEFVLSFD